jgi:hypothetical protein
MPRRMADIVPAMIEGLLLAFIKPIMPPIKLSAPRTIRATLEISITSAPYFGWVVW